jgi:hypothetical protein
VFIATAAFCLALLASDPVPLPDAEAIARAEKQVNEIYAAGLAKAKSPLEQLDLAREFVTAARKIDDDPAGQLVLLRMGRDLALAAKDRTVALDAVRTLAERFRPDGPTDPTEQVKRGAEIWEKAQRASGAERLRLQMEAAEWFIRAQSDATGLAKQLAEKRLAEIVGPAVSDSNERYGERKTAGSSRKSAKLSSRFKPGLIAEFFNDTKCAHRVKARIDSTIDFNCRNNQSPDPDVNSRDYGVRWSGYLKVSTPGSYRIVIESDDGSSVFLDGQCLVSKLTPSAHGRYTATVVLKSGYHPLQVAMLQGHGPSHCHLLWANGNEEEKVIPADCFFHDVKGEVAAGIRSKP